MSCGVGHRHSWDPALLWLWHGPAATTPIWSLAWEPPYAVGAALKRPKKKKRCFCFFGCAHGTLKFLGLSSNLSHSSDNAGSLTHWATKGLIKSLKYTLSIPLWGNHLRQEQRLMRTSVHGGLFMEWETHDWTGCWRHCAHGQLM